MIKEANEKTKAEWLDVFSREDCTRKKMSYSEMMKYKEDRLDVWDKTCGLDEFEELYARAVLEDNLKDLAKRVNRAINFKGVDFYKVKVDVGKVGKMKDSLYGNVKISLVSVDSFVAKKKWLETMLRDILDEAFERWDFVTVGDGDIDITGFVFIDKWKCTDPITSACMNFIKEEFGKRRCLTERSLQDMIDMKMKLGL